VAADCDHEFDLMDRCRRCGYRLTGDEQREREYEALVSRNRTPGAPAGRDPESWSSELF
jgi:hypothetical protein